MKRIRLLMLMLAAGGCVIPDEPPFDPDGGRVCYSDSDCAANACCGDATFAVHVSDAPSCGGVSCDGGCPRGSIDCGCGLPVCKNNRCVTARTVGQGCP